MQMQQMGAPPPQQMQPTGGGMPPPQQEMGDDQTGGGCPCAIMPVCVSEGHVGIVQSWGEFVGIRNPGLACACPPFLTIESVPTALQTMQCDSACKTQDNVTVNVSTTIQYHIQKSKIKTARFGIKDPTGQIRAEVDSVLRSTIPQMDLDKAFEAKDEIINNILEELQESMAVFGYTITQVLITDLSPEASVQQAMNQVNIERRNLDAARARAESIKILKIKQAEADAQTTKLSGVGLAKMRREMADGFKESVAKFTASGVSPDKAMHMMLTSQYLDTLKVFAASGRSSVLVPSDASGGKGIEGQVRDAMLTNRELR